MFTRRTLYATPPRYCCITSPSRSSPTQTQLMTLLRGLRGSSGAGLRPKFFERTYVVEGDLLVVPSKRRRSPRPATPNGTPLSERHPHPTFQPPPGPVLQIFRFAPFGNTKFARMLCITISLLAAFHSRRSHRLVLVVYVRLKKSNCVGLTVLFSNAWKTRTGKCITSFQSHRPGNLLVILLFC